MNQIFLHKVQHGIEALFIFLTIAWQPVFGIIASVAAIWYYAAMLKHNVINKDFGGSWKSYLSKLFKRKS